MDPDGNWVSEKSNFLNQLFKDDCLRTKSAKFKQFTGISNHR